MENIIKSGIKLYQNQRKFSLELVTFHFFNAFKMGMYGFSIIFLLIFFGNLFTYLLGVNNSLNMNIFDILLSCVGFLLQFFLYFMKRYSAKYK